jgi:hypothetical protein
MKGNRVGISDLKLTSENLRTAARRRETRSRRQRFVSMLLSSPGTVIARKAEHATEIIVRCEGNGR